ncbi:MAG TPA: metal ABC transporter permease [Chloroflexota bacterium]|jgi:manganese/iron transport system permease protein|nr:metal ABC transporter permease [Chloroflexota bacterium]
MGLFLDPLQMPFMRTGLAEVLLLAVACGLIGPFVVYRRLTFLAHALSHTIFPTVVLAAILRMDLVLGAAMGAALTLALVLLLQGRRGVGDDSAVAIAFVGLFALGVVLVGLFRVRSRDVAAALTGNLLGVGPTDLLLSAGLVVVLMTAITVFYRPLVLTSFDRVSAVALGLPTGLLDLVMLVLVAGTAIVSVQVVGVILTIATLVTPAATAQFWARRLRVVMLLAAVLGAAAGALGLYVAYYVPVAPSGVIVLVLSAFFGLSTLIAPRGLIARRLVPARAERVHRRAVVG